MEALTAPTFTTAVAYKDVIEQTDCLHTTVLPDGSCMHQLNNGLIVQAEYANGARMRRNLRYCLVQTPEGGTWFGNDKGLWLMFD